MRRCEMCDREAWLVSKPRSNPLVGTLAWCDKHASARLSAGLMKREDYDEIKIDNEVDPSVSPFTGAQG